MRSERFTFHLLEDLKQDMVAGGLVTAHQFRTAEQEADLTNESIGRVLINKGFATLDSMLSFVEGRLHIPYVNLDQYKIDESAIRRLPPSVAVNYKAIPLFEIEGVLTVAMADPVDIISVDRLMDIAQCPTEVVLASEVSITSAIYRWYGATEVRRNLIEGLAARLKEARTKALPGPRSGTAEPATQAELSEQSAIALVNQYIVQALLERASDIHLEPRRGFLTVRFRIDGILHKRFQLPASSIAPLIARIKIMAGMDIAEKRVPQDGRMGLMVMDREIDVRVSSYPCMHGEKVVLRILDKTSHALALSELGFAAEVTGLEELATGTTGIVLATGPTGSGKTTTLYAMLNGMSKTEKNIMTVEDPIEYGIEGIVQSQVQPKVGLTFANALRSILRQDPDVIYVGEIRDRDTAEIAVHAALTGHLVLSTLHTNDAASAVIRLMDIGIEPYLISSALLAVIAQRLVRLNCEHCREPETIDPLILDGLGVAKDEVFYKGAGCEQCAGTGYAGRTAVCELLKVSPELRARIVPGISVSDIRAQALKDGTTPLMENALARARQGDICLAEVYRTRLE